MYDPESRDNSNSLFFGECIRYFDGYVPLFHQKTFLVHKLFQTVKIWHEFGEKHVKEIIETAEKIRKSTNEEQNTKNSMILYDVELVQVLEAVRSHINNKYKGQRILLFAQSIDEDIPPKGAVRGCMQGVVTIPLAKGILHND
jgi:hypothetical protein